MKLLVLFAAGTAVAATATAVRGLDVDAAVVSAKDDTPAALADALQAAAGEPGRSARVKEGLRLARTRFSQAASAERLEAALGQSVRRG